MRTTAVIGAWVNVTVRCMGNVSLTVNASVKMAMKEATVNQVYLQCIMFSMNIMKAWLLVKFKCKCTVAITYAMNTDQYCVMYCVML